MFGSQRSLLARRMNLFIVFFWSEMGSCLYWNISLVFFSKTASGCFDPGIDFFFCSVFEMWDLCEVF